VVFVPYYKFSAMYHLEGMPPLCVLHGIDDELVPFNQSVMLAAELERRGMPPRVLLLRGLEALLLDKRRQCDHAADVPGFVDCLAGFLGNSDAQTSSTTDARYLSGAYAKPPLLIHAEMHWQLVTISFNNLLDNQDLLPAISTRHSQKKDAGMRLP